MAVFKNENAKIHTPSHHDQKNAIHAIPQEYTTNDHMEKLREEMMMQMDGHSDSNGPFPHREEVENKKEVIHPTVEHSMVFNVIMNRKQEKVLMIEGFDKNAQAIDGYGSEDSGDNGDNLTLFINLNKLFQNKTSHVLDDEI